MTTPESASPPPSSTDPAPGEAAEEAQWLALVDKVLRGAPIDRLRTTTLDGVVIDPLYRADRSRAEESPGAFPFTRGATGPRPAGSWDVNVLIDQPDPAAANRSALDQLQEGANGLVIRLADGMRGLPGDAAQPLGGVVATSSADMATCLAGVVTDAAPVTLDAGASGFDAADWALAADDVAGVDPAASLLRLAVDPIGAAAFSGRADSLGPELGRLGSLAETHRSRRGVIGLSTASHVDAGCTEVQELAALLATGVAYLRCLEAVNIDPTEAQRLLHVSLSLSVDQFATVAKLRAARRLWAHLMTSTRVDHADAGLQIDGATSRFMLTRHDPWVNLLRSTVAVAAGAIGGVQGMCVVPFDALWGPASDLGRRIARNTQLVLQDESNLGRPVDPAAGSEYVERLTDEFTRLGWDLFVDVERRGGMAAVLADGWWSDQIAQRATERDAAVAKRSIAVTGVSEFPNIDEQPPEIEPEPADARARLDRWRAGRGPVEPGPHSLRPRHIADRWEQLRDRCDEAATRPRALLVQLGSPAEINARETWTRNLLEACGLAVTASPEGEADASAADLVCLCGTDATYDERGESVVRAFAGQSPVVVAGRPADHAPMAAAGAVGFLRAGVDVLAILEPLILTALDRSAP